MKKSILIYINLCIGLLANFTLSAQNVPVNTARPAVTPRTHIVPYAAPAKINYVRAWEASMPSTDATFLTSPTRTVSQVKQTTRYFDGIGREIQNVIKQITPLGKDQVTIHTFDALSRESVKYMSFPSAAGTGDFRSSPFPEQQSQLQAIFPGEQIFYSEATFDGSFMNRELNTYSQGNSWALPGGNKPVENRIMANTTNDDVRAWKLNAAMPVPIPVGAYPQGALPKKVMKNENGLRTIEFLNEFGKVVLKRTEETPGATDGHTGWLSTYYVYDDRQQLRFVVPPKATAALQVASWNFATDATLVPALCFTYRYDLQHRITEQKAPGTDPVYFVYDPGDNKAFMQDGNLRAANKWIATLHDAQERPVMTAVYTPPTPQTRDQLQTAVNAAGSGQTYINSIPAAQLEPLAYSTYDQYPSGALAYNATLLNELTAGGNDYPDPQPQSNYVKSKLTHTSVKVLGTTQWLASTYYYDSKGRVLQTVMENMVGGKDITSNRYSFDDMLLSSFLQHTSTLSTESPQTQVLKEMKYDGAARLIKLTVQLNKNTTTRRTIAEYEYNELGQLKTKKLGQQLNSDGTLSTTPVEILQTAYNVRGWISSINKNYINPASGVPESASWFGMELSYDYGHTNAQYNGTVSGVKWRSKGDGEKRSLGLEYDAVGRMVKSDFTQLAGTAWNTSSGVDYSEYGAASVSVPGRTISQAIAYDKNGNLSGLKRKGLKLTTSPVIDDLTYTFVNNGNSNQLLAVTDAQGFQQLADFKDANKPLDDYTYDKNGNLSADKNKGITGITYNHLNLPSVVTFGSKGNIQYLYDASGRKLRKIITETGKPIVTWDYFGDISYRNNILQQINHPEGRVRNEKIPNGSGQLINVFVYDYFLKDHLTNIRMVLTEEKKKNVYAATAETAMQPLETQLFSNLTPEAKPAGYPADATTNPNDFVTRLNSGDATKRVGVSIVLKVMAGDKIAITGKYFYKSQGYNGARTVTTTQMLAQILSAFGGSSTGSDGKFVIGERNNATFGSAYPTLLDGLRNSDPSNNQDTKPKAYLNFLLFDEQFKLVNNNSGIRQANGAADVLNTFPLAQFDVARNGYLYVYLNNESTMDVFFDNLMVSHESGPLLEETHYYPFGQEMTGISSRALGKIENKQGFNGNEIQSGEFTDRDGLELYDFNARMYDQQLGRFLNMDPLSEKAYDWSPYRFGFDNPLTLADPSGKYEVHLREGDPGFDALISQLFSQDDGNKDINSIIDAIEAARPFGENKNPLLMSNLIFGGEALRQSTQAFMTMLFVTGGQYNATEDCNCGLSATAIGNYFKHIYREMEPGGNLAAILRNAVRTPARSWHVHIPAGLYNGIPYAGHGNDKANTNPHLVYAIYAITNNGTEVLKYGIADLIRWGPERPDGQIANLMLQERKFVDWTPVIYVPNRQMALDVEAKAIEIHTRIYGHRPRYNL